MSAANDIVSVSASPPVVFPPIVILPTRVIFPATSTFPVTSKFPAILVLPVAQSITNLSKLSPNLKSPVESICNACVPAV